MTVRKRSHLEVLLEAVAQEPRRSYFQNNFRFLRNLLLSNVALLGIAAIDRGSLAVDIAWTYCPAVNVGFLAVSFFRGTKLRERSTDFNFSRHVIVSLMPLALLLGVDLAISQLPGHASSFDPVEHNAAPAPAPKRGRAAD